MTTIAIASVQRSSPQLPSVPTDKQTPDSQRIQPLATNHQFAPAQAGALKNPNAATASDNLKQSLAKHQDFKWLGQKLNTIAMTLGVNATPQEISAELKTALMEIHPDSPYRIEGDSPVTIETYIRDHRWRIPTSHFNLTSLANALHDRVLEHPLGNFGGSLSWPLPLSASGQRTLLDSAIRYSSNNPNKPQMGPSLGVLEYLNSNQPLVGAALNDPAKALETIISSARAQAFGKSLQTQLNGIATDTSINDYTLAAINLTLDQESIESPHRNKVAGFDLAQQSHWGKPVSAVLTGLIEHLSNTDRTTPEMAKVGAFLLLARKAPELLVKDIPKSVTYGSPAWVSLSIAAATIEAQTPGKVPNMSFAQIMTGAENAAFQDLAITQQAQKKAMLDWAVVNGVISPKKDENYGPNEIERVRVAFNQQINERVVGSQLLETAIPSRKEIALAKLKEQFGEHVPFEEKLLKVNDLRGQIGPQFYNPLRAPVGFHSLLDIAMGGMTRYEWESTDPRIPAAFKNCITENKVPPEFDVKAVFDEQFTQAIDSRKKGIATIIKHLIAQLPLPDRKNFEYGQLEFIRGNSYERGFPGFTFVGKDETLYVRTTGANGVAAYEINLSEGKIEPTSTHSLTRSEEMQGANVYRLEKFTPTTASYADLSQKSQENSSLPPTSFTSARTESIAKVFIEHLDIDNKDVVKQAKGTTAFEQQREDEGKVLEFFLDLIPLRSAIVNFSNGNYGAGVTDLALDIFGFLTAGTGAASKAVKVVGNAVRTADKTLAIAKIIGTTVIGELNPLSGVGDLIGGGVRLVNKGLRQGINKLSGATGSYNLLKATNDQSGVVTLGTFKVSGQTFEGVTILHNGQRYAYNPAIMKPYGAPLEAFSPVDGLMPPSPNASSSNHRYNPLNRNNRPANRQPPANGPVKDSQTAIIKTDHLSEEEYVTSIKGTFSEAHFTPSRKVATREKFDREMNDFYQRMEAGEQPPRPAIPNISKQVTTSELISKGLDASNGLVFGENHKHMASFQTLFDNVDTFKQKNVKKLYIEATFYDSQMKLKDDGIGFLGDGLTPRFPSFNQLVKRFTDNGIEVVPLDHAFLTRHKDERSVFKATNHAEQNVPRLKEFNYYAAQTIRQNSSGENWIALMGNAHMNSTQGVPGVAELTGGIGVGIFKRTDPGPSMGIRKTGHVPDPTQALRPTDLPGDLHIFKQVKAPPATARLPDTARWSAVAIPEYHKH